MDKDTEQALIQDHLAKANYHAAFNIALSALNACRREGDQAGIEHFLAIIKDIVAAMEAEFGRS